MDIELNKLMVFVYMFFSNLKRFIYLSVYNDISYIWINNWSIKLDRSLVRVMETTLNK
jgi:hypothetical protein